MKTNKDAVIDVIVKETKDTIGDPVSEDANSNPGLFKKMAPSQHTLSGADAEDIRSLNRGLTAIRMDMSEAMVLKDSASKQMETINKRYCELEEKVNSCLADFTKKSTELQRVVDTAFNKLKLNPADKWQFDAEACTFHKD